MIEMDLVLVSSGSLVRTPFALGEDLSPATRCEVSRASFPRLPGGLRAARRSKDPFQRRLPPGGVSGASLNAGDSPQLLRIESP